MKTDHWIDVCSNTNFYYMYPTAAKKQGGRFSWSNNLGVVYAHSIQEKEGYGNCIDRVYFDTAENMVKAQLLYF